MAAPHKRLLSNAPGEFFVDSTCIDCGACRWIAPSSFAAEGEHSAVYRQPDTHEQRLEALKALVCCPTGSIGTEHKHDLRPVVAAFPAQIEGGVHHCGFHDKSSFGAASYLIIRKEGNVLVDVPRFTRPLLRRIEELGGVALMFLTHRDDVADHEKFHAHFGCPRVLHKSDVGSSTRGVEIQPAGVAPVELGPGLLMIQVPGHTRGSACLLHQEDYLFSGDHLAWSREDGRVYAFADACWYDWTTQIDSMERLADYRFRWVLPGHGSPGHLGAAEMQQEVRECVRWMQAERAA